MTDHWTLVVAFLLGTIATARATRLITHDTWPPSEWLREWWYRRTITKGRRGGIRQDWRRGWYDLLTCPFCFAPYAAAVNLTWAVLAGVHQPGAWSWWERAWWVVNTWAAVSYLAAILNARDTPEES